MLNTIANHRSIRRYTDRPVDDSLLRTIVEAGTRASNTGNMQTYSIVATRSADVRKALMPAHFNQPMVETAAVVLTFCVDFCRFGHWCRLRDAEPGFGNFESFISAAIDASLAAQNVCLAAEAHGLGGCYLGTTTYNPDVIIEALGLPRGVMPVTTLTLGYPAEDPGLTERLPVEAVLHMETYHQCTDADIDRLYAEKESLPQNRQFVAENHKRTLAQVFTDVRYTRANNEHFSRVLLDTLRRQGFDI